MGFIQPSDSRIFDAETFRISRVVCLSTTVSHDSALSQPNPAVCEALSVYHDEVGRVGNVKSFTHRCGSEEHIVIQTVLFRSEKNAARHPFEIETANLALFNAQYTDSLRHNSRNNHSDRSFR